MAFFSIKTSVPVSSIGPRLRQHHYEFFPCNLLTEELRAKTASELPTGHFKLRWKRLGNPSHNYSGTALTLFTGFLFAAFLSKVGFLRKNMGEIRRQRAINSPVAPSALWFLAGERCIQIFCPSPSSTRYHEIEIVDWQELIEYRYNVFLTPPPPPSLSSVWCLAENRGNETKGQVTNVHHSEIYIIRIRATWFFSFPLLLFPLHATGLGPKTRKFGSDKTHHDEVRASLEANNTMQTKKPIQSHFNWYGFVFLNASPDEARVRGIRSIRRRTGCTARWWSTVS